MATVTLVDQDRADLFFEELRVDRLRAERSRKHQQYPELHHSPRQAQILRMRRKGGLIGDFNISGGSPPRSPATWPAFPVSGAGPNSSSFWLIRPGAP